MRPHGKTKLGFFPLPAAEADRIRNSLMFPAELSALDPCVGDGVAFTQLLKDATAHRYGIEIDANRAEQARTLGIETLHANTMDVRCLAEALSLICLNPPHDLEFGEANNQRLELVFLEHTYRWLRPGGILIFVIPQRQLRTCARLLAEHFTAFRIYRLTEPECIQFKQIAIFAVRRKRHDRLRDSALLESIAYLESLTEKRDLEILCDAADARYEIPPSGRAELTHIGIPSGVRFFTDFLRYDSARPAETAAYEEA